MLSFYWHGIELSRKDFGDDLRGWIAFTIAFTINTHCIDKEAALELLYGEADEIIDRVRSNTPLLDPTVAPDLLAACLYCQDMLRQKVGDETLAERIGLIGGLRAAKLLDDAIARVAEVDDPTREG